VLTFLDLFQVGCFVPATSARLAPVDAIYSRMGANDFIFANASTFKVEMDDCNKILTKVRPLASLARIWVDRSPPSSNRRHPARWSSSMSLVEGRRRTTAWPLHSRCSIVSRRTWAVSDSSRRTLLRSRKTLRTTLSEHRRWRRFLCGSLCLPRRRIRLCNMSTQVDDETRAVVFLYKLVRLVLSSASDQDVLTTSLQINGSSPKSYGPHVASMAGLPE
jgi:DNA mismatch repair protein MSH6